MNLWLRATHLYVLVGVSVASVLLYLLGGGLPLALPTTLGVLLEVPTYLIVPLIPTLATSLCLSPNIAAEAVASRHIQARVTALIMANLAAICGLIALAQLAGIGHNPTAFIRNLLGFTGIVLLTAWLIGARLSGVVAATYFILAATVGHVTAQTPRWWAWPIDPNLSLSNWVIPVAICVAGAGLMLTRPALRLRPE